MPKIKSLLNGEVSNVRADIAREMIKLGVALALDPAELATQPACFGPRLPKAGDYVAPACEWNVITLKKPVSGGHELAIQLLVGSQEFL